MGDLQMIYRAIFITILLSITSSYATDQINPDTDIAYLGAFRIPDYDVGGIDYSASTSLSYDPTGNGGAGSLITRSGDRTVGEISIPDELIRSDYTNLNTASQLGTWIDVTGGFFAQRALDFPEEDNNMWDIGDVQYLPAQGSFPAKWHWVAYEYYMPEVNSNKGFGWSDLDGLNSEWTWGLSFPDPATSGYLFDIPSDWADTYVGGETLGGGRYRIVNGGSNGPALYSFAPWLDGTPPTNGTNITHATELLHYPDEDRLDHYGSADRWNDAAWLTVGSKAALMIAGTKGIRDKENELAYYATETHFEPYACTNNKGNMAEPYLAQILFYDVDELASTAVNGQPTPRQQPYAWWNIQKYLYAEECAEAYLSGVAYDRANGLIYIAEQAVDGAYSKIPVVHVFELTAGSGSLDTAAPSVPTGLNISGQTDTQLTLTWGASTDTTSTPTYMVYRFYADYVRWDADIPHSMGDQWLPINLTTSTSFVDTHLSVYDTHVYKVAAFDELNNYSAMSASISSTTPEPPTCADTPSLCDTAYKCETDPGSYNWCTDVCQAAACEEPGPATKTMWSFGVSTTNWAAPN